MSSSEQEVNLQNIVKIRNKSDIKDGNPQMLRVLNQMLNFVRLAFFWDQKYVVDIHELSVFCRALSGLAKPFLVVYSFLYGGWWLFRKKRLSSFLKPDLVFGPWGAQGHNHPFVVQFVMEFSATQQKSSVPDSLKRVGEDAIDINP